MSNALIEQIKQLDEQREQLIDEARDLALEQANTAVATLNELGFDYQLVSKPERRKQKRSRTTPASKPPEALPAATD